MYKLVKKLSPTIFKKIIKRLCSFIVKIGINNLDSQVNQTNLINDKEFLSMLEILSYRITNLEIELERVKNCD
jgi:hypothetical protein